jgi:hypothetical protein
MTTIHADLITKPAKKAAKPAAPKAAPKAPAAKKAPAPKAAKPAAKKPAAKKAAKEAPAAPAPKGVRCMNANRPGSGVLLFAYTEAVLRLLGMYEGAEIEKTLLMKVMGLTAIGYHTTQKANMQRLDNGRYILTACGKAFFAERAGRAVAADVDGWIEVLSTGQADGRLVKNQALLTAI